MDAALVFFAGCVSGMTVLLAVIIIATGKRGDVR